MEKIKDFVEKHIVKISMLLFVFSLIIFFAYVIYVNSSEDYVPTKTHIQHIDNSPQEWLSVKMLSTIVRITEDEEVVVYVTPSDLDKFYRLVNIFNDRYVDVQEVFILHSHKKICNTEYFEAGDVLYTTLTIDDEFNITIHPSEATKQRLLTCF